MRKKVNNMTQGLLIYTHKYQFTTEQRSVSTSNTWSPKYVNLEHHLRHVKTNFCCDYVTATCTSFIQYTLHVKQI